MANPGAGAHFAMHSRVSQDTLLPQGGAVKVLHGDNPPATVESTMRPFGNHLPINAYLRAPG